MLSPVFSFLCLLAVSLMAKAKKRNGRRSEISERDRSVEDWLKMSKEVLKLRCDTLHIISDGTRREIAERLRHYYHPPQLPPPPPNVDIGDNIVEDGNDRDGTVPYDGDDLSNPADNAAATSSASGVGISEERMIELIQSVVSSSVKEVNSHVRALHSQVVHLQNQTKSSSPNTARSAPTIITTTTPSPAHTHTLTSSNNNTSASSVSGAVSGMNVFSTAPVHVVGNNVSSVSAQQAQVSGTFPLFSSNILSPSRSPYPLPAIDKKMADAIEKGEYVDFDKLIRKKLGDKSKEERRKGVQCHLKAGAIDGEETTLLLKKAKVDTVSSFTEWMVVWNLFMQTRLHFHPEEACELIRYQAHITSFSQKHKWGAVYAYDIDFRHHISLERNLPKHERQWRWEEKSAELMNEDLHNSFLAPKALECYSCGQEGHMSPACPQRASKKPRKGSMGGYSQQQSGQYHQQTTPMPQPGLSHRMYPGYSTHATTPFPPTMPTFPAPPRQQLSTQQTKTVQQYCNTWNATGDCPRGFRCRFKHECNKCGQKPDHGGIFCDRVSSSNFLPPTSR